MRAAHKFDYFNGAINLIEQSRTILLRTSFDRVRAGPSRTTAVINCVGVPDSCGLSFDARDVLMSERLVEANGLFSPVPNLESPGSTAGQVDVVFCVCQARLCRRKREIASANQFEFWDGDEGPLAETEDGLSDETSPAGCSL